MHVTPPKLLHVLSSLTDAQRTLIDTAKSLYQERLAYFCQQTHHPPAFITAAPGRVNLIGEHVDYQNGLVLPMCLDANYQTICYGTGFLHTSANADAPTSIRVRLVSDQAEAPEMIEERRFTVNSVNPPPPPAASDAAATADDEGEDEETAASSKWVNYVIGVIAQYLPDIPATGCVLDLAMAYASSVPVAAGLSSSAALEVATALFIECFLHDGMAFSSAHSDFSNDVVRALRCQTAEQTWAHTPCGIMDQYVVSCTAADAAPQLIDCRSLVATPVVWKRTPDAPVVLITNSRVPHDNANDAQYGQRRRECHEAVLALQSVPLYHVESLRDAVLSDLTTGRQMKKLDDRLYQRAHHVVSENVRTTECAVALRLGLWEKVGQLLNASHASLRDDFQVSCAPVDVLVALAQAQAGVYGSRMTGGGFGGCTVTLVQPDAVAAVVAALQKEYHAQTGLHCDCFVTRPGAGASVLAIDVDCQPESDFYKTK
jgi:galactokinase